MMMAMVVPMPVMVSMMMSVVRATATTLPIVPVLVMLPLMVVHAAPFPMCAPASAVAIGRDGATPDARVRFHGKALP